MSAWEEYLKAEQEWSEAAAARLVAMRAEEAAAVALDVARMKLRDEWGLDNE